MLPPIQQLLEPKVGELAGLIDAFVFDRDIDIPLAAKLLRQIGGDYQHGRHLTVADLLLARAGSPQGPETDSSWTTSRSASAGASKSSGWNPSPRGFSNGGTFGKFSAPTTTTILGFSSCAAANWK